MSSWQNAGMMSQFEGALHFEPNSDAARFGIRKYNSQCDCDHSWLRCTLGIVKYSTYNECLIFICMKEMLTEHRSSTLEFNLEIYEHAASLPLVNMPAFQSYIDQNISCLRPASFFKFFKSDSYKVLGVISTSEVSRIRMGIQRPIFSELKQHAQD